MANFQSYPVTGPDLVNRYYWVITTKNGCSQKTYFNTPVAITNVQPASAAGLSIYPNPAGDIVNIEVNMPQGNNAELTITNMLGQTVKQASLTGSSIQFDMAGMPAGCYLVTCSQNGVKVAVGRLIKN